MENLGIATPKVKLLPRLPNVGSFVTKVNFDSNAHNWSSLLNSPFFEPFLIESVIDPAGTIAALMPSKRVFWVNNYLEGNPASQADGSDLKITWTQLDEAAAVDSIMENIIPDFNAYSILVPPASYAAGGTPPVDMTTYEGPTWRDDNQNREPPPNDLQDIQEFFNWVGGTDIVATPDADADADADADNVEIEDINWVYMTRVKDGLWWGMQSNSFLNTNMPFWIILNKMQPPTSPDHDTVFVISLGLSDENHRFDIYLSLNSKPRIVDWLGGTDSGVPQIQKEFEAEGSRIWSTGGTHRIGIMTIAGRLVVLIDDYPLVYSRIDRSSGDDGGKLLECKIASGAINIWGTNAKVAFNVSPMTFAEFGAIALPIPVLAGDAGSGSTPVSFQGVDQEGQPSNSVCHLPTPDGNQKFGCDCAYFSGDGGSASPDGFGFHQEGKIKFQQASNNTFNALPSTEFYTLQFAPENTTTPLGTIPYGGAPYYFRLKGISIQEGEDPGAGTAGDITGTVISINETATAPDYFHTKKSLDVTCYDEGGSLSSALVANQSGIEVSWGWDGSSEKTFTGVITNVSTSQKAGMEVVNIRAEDYMFILKHTPIVNSPFYDGMVAYYALKDMAQRASLTGFTNDWTSTNDYFLPAGFAFSKPKMRYSGSQMIFDCMMDIVKRFEAFVYFDEGGKLVVTRLPGGLFSSGFTTSASFVSDPLAAVEKVILEEKKVEIDFTSTVNVISAMTLERDTRNAILYTKSASGSENNLLFKKVYLLNQAALGELEVCRNYVEDLSDRMFYPIIKTQWKTASTTMVKPLEFVNVDTQPFRVTSLKRSFNAESNDLTTSYEGEWLGGN